MTDLINVYDIYVLGINMQGFIWVFSGAEVQPNSQWNLGDFFPNFEKKSKSSKKFFFSFEIGIFIQSTHTSYMVMISFNLMAIVCDIANLYFLNKNDRIVHETNSPI